MKYLLDTNILSESIKTRPNPSVLARIEQYQEDIVTAAPVYHELQYGFHRMPESRKRKTIEIFLNEVVKANLAILPYDDKAAEWHAQERARLASLGKTPSFADGQIAAITKVNRLVLVTRNVSDFERFNRIAIENWYR